MVEAGGESTPARDDLLRPSRGVGVLARLPRMGTSFTSQNLMVLPPEPRLNPSDLGRDGLIYPIWLKNGASIATCVYQIRLSGGLV
jgi:hypothetical protein